MIFSAQAEKREISRFAQLQLGGDPAARSRCRANGSQNIFGRAMSIHLRLIIQIRVKTKLSYHDPLRIYFSQLSIRSPYGYLVAT